MDTPGHARTFEASDGLFIQLMSSGESKRHTSESLLKLSNSVAKYFGPKKMSLRIRLSGKTSDIFFGQPNAAYSTSNRLDKSFFLTELHRVEYVLAQRSGALLRWVTSSH